MPGPIRNQTMKKLLWFAIAAFAITAQDARISIVGSGRPKMGIPDFRGSGEAQAFIGAFNQTLWDDVKGAGLFDMVAKTSYPTFVPQQPSDFQTPAAPSQTGGGDAPCRTGPARLPS